MSAATLWIATASKAASATPSATPSKTPSQPPAKFNHTVPQGDCQSHGQTRGLNCSHSGDNSTSRERQPLTGNPETVTPLTEKTEAVKRAKMAEIGHSPPLTEKPEAVDGKRQSQCATGGLPIMNTLKALAVMLLASFGLGFIFSSFGNTQNAAATVFGIGVFLTIGAAMLYKKWFVDTKS